MQCACIVLANAAGARGARSNGRSQEANSPPPTGRARGEPRQEGRPRSRQKGSSPPPLPADKCRATCSHRARNVHAQGERATNQTTAAGKHGGYTVVVECACNVRATCLSPEAGTQDTKGTEGSHTANHRPPRRARTRGTEASWEAKKGRANRKRAPPPPYRQVPRLVLASCSQRACSGGKATRAPPPPPPQPFLRGRKGEMGGDTGVNTRPEGETGGKQWGHPAA